MLTASEAEVITGMVEGMMALAAQTPMTLHLSIVIAFVSKTACQGLLAATASPTLRSVTAVMVGMVVATQQGLAVLLITMRPLSREIITQFIIATHAIIRPLAAPQLMVTAVMVGMVVATPPAAMRTHHLHGEIIISPQTPTPPLTPPLVRAQGLMILRLLVEQILAPMPATAQAPWSTHTLIISLFRTQ
jgi:hypothetical protein